jgi:phosphoserine phosphatase RsbU/P
MTTIAPRGARPDTVHSRSIVLLVDDQPIIAEAVRRMLASEPDIVFHYCPDPKRAVEMASLVRPTVILQDLVMPEIDGLTLVKMFRQHAATRETPMIVLSTKEEPKVKAEAFGLGANDYLVKLPDRIELLARIRHHSRGYNSLLERNDAYEALLASERQLAEEMSKAAKYVESLLPKPIKTGPIRTDWRFVPSTQLGGDSFGYHWLDDDHFAVYLLDVCGHGVGAALLSVSVMNVLRSQSLPNTDFRKPEQVLFALNEAFKMREHNDMFFTIWYGVYRTYDRLLTFSDGGHPPGLLFRGGIDGQVAPEELEVCGTMIGVKAGLNFRSSSATVDAGSKLYLFSDGVYEITLTNGKLWPFKDFLGLMAEPPDFGSTVMDRLLHYARTLRGGDALDDDFSIVEVTF